MCTVGLGGKTYPKHAFFSSGAHSGNCGGQPGTDPAAVSSCIMSPFITLPVSFNNVHIRDTVYVKTQKRVPLVHSKVNETTQSCL